MRVYPRGFFPTLLSSASSCRASPPLLFAAARELHANPERGPGRRSDQRPRRKGKEGNREISVFSQRALAANPRAVIPRVIRIAEEPERFPKFSTRKIAEWGLCKYSVVVSPRNDGYVSECFVGKQAVTRGRGWRPRGAVRLKLKRIERPSDAGGWHVCRRREKRARRFFHFSEGCASSEGRNNLIRSWRYLWRTGGF